MRNRSWSVLLFATLLVIGTLQIAAAQPDGTVVTEAAPTDSVSLAAPIGNLAQDVEKLRSPNVATNQVGETGRYVVEFVERADLDAARDIADRGERGRFVVDTLRTTAEASQRDAVELVESRGGTADEFWSRNAIVVDADDALLAELAALPGVREVRPERVFPLIQPVEQGDVIEVAAGDPEWGVSRIGADAVWEQGILGGGVVVASLDSGVDFLHEALVEKYRGNNGDGTFTHDYNWFDASADCPTEEPCDLFGHGTHTMGTMVGGDGPGPFGPDIGVAPGAQWITVSCGPGFCSESQLMAAGEWFLAPTDINGENPDPDRRPDIINNSWGGGPGDPFFLDMVAAWRAAGMVPVFASGNPGPFCGEGGSPGDYVESFSVGATDIDDVIAEFSGRGPSAFGKVNPDVSAPGVDVVSSVPGGGYESNSGTSMAAPHVSGTLALMMSASPDLAGDVESATSIVASTAFDIVDLECGGDDDGDPNNVYGEGRIDAAMAVDLVASGGVLTGAVADSATNAPIPGATVTANDGEREFASFADENGVYQLFLPEGEYTVLGSAFGYEASVVSGIVIVADATTTQDLLLDALPTYTVSGVVRSLAGRPISGAEVEVLGAPVDPVVTDNRGNYSFTLPLGTYVLEAGQGGCMSTDTHEVELFSDVTQDFTLVQLIDDFGHGCDPIPFRWVDAGAPTTMFGDDSTGRLPMPFDFPYYDNTYNDLFITTNGYVAFVDDFFGFSEFFNTPIPSSQPPNDAIYVLWQDLWVYEADHRIEWDVITQTGKTGLVVEFVNNAALGQSAGASFELKLWEDGTIDMLYGEGMANVGNGSSATVGIENAFGSDGLMYSHREPVLEEGTALRFSKVPVGTLSGTITNANDGLPVAGAAVTASPTDRSTTSGEDGTYEMLLVPGGYEITIEAPGYEPATATVTMGAGRTTTLDVALLAPIAEVSPTEIAAEVEIDESDTTTLTISNTGSAVLTWEVKETDTTEMPGEEPPPEEPVAEPTHHVIRTASWERQAIPEGFGPSYTTEPTFEGPLDVVIDDPAGDGGPVDITTVSAGADEFELSVEIAFTDDTPMFESVGLFYIDTDQDPSTGLPAEAIDGLPTQTIGMERFIDMFEAPFGFGYVVDANTFEFLGEIAVETIGQTYRFDVSSELLGDEDGAVNIGMVMGTYEGPNDWAPDVGAGEIGAFKDTLWMAADPESGELAPGESTEVSATLGGSGVAPGEYTGIMTFATNDPRQANHEVATALTVVLPDDFGSVSGTVTNYRDGSPVPADIVVTAERDGAPYVATAVTNDAIDVYTLYAPEGTWPIEATSTLPVVSFSGEVTVVAGEETVFDIAMDPIWPFATLDGAPLEFTLNQGDSDSGELTLGNVDGLADLEFAVFELEGVAEEPPEPVVLTRPEPRGSLTGSDVAADGYTASPVAPVFQQGATALVFLDALPWDSDALFQVLDGNGVVYDVAGSADMGSVPLSDYDVVFVSNDQPQDFYDTYVANAAEFEDYVTGGGFLWFGAAAEGWNGGSLDGAPLPGGVGIVGGQFEEFNFLANPDHPVVAGVPDPFFGTSASHSTFLSNPEGSTIAFGEFSLNPTLIEYDVGVGKVLAIGQPMEFAWMEGQDAAIILENSVPYAMAFQPFTDVPWVNVTPSEGTIAIGAEALLTVSVDAAGLDPGEYLATLVVLTNDPANTKLEAEVLLSVAG